MNCQAVGCQEFALPWGTEIDVGGVDVALRLCRRHSNDLELGGGTVSPGAPHAAPAPLVLVCGSRDWEDGYTIRKRLLALPRGTTLMHGGARGADLIAAAIGAGLGMRIIEHAADWARFGRGAGYRRNAQMLNERPDMVLAFQRNGSRGTQHVIDEARKRDITTVVVEEWTL